MIRLICLLVGYCIGCVQTAYAVGRMKAGIDIRQLGSGNAGTTNVARVFGAPIGAVVFIVDMLKGVAAFFLCQFLFGISGAALASAGLSVAGLYGGIGAVLGHNFPFFLKFRGGKGVASSLGVMIAADWRIALPVFAVGIAIIAVTRYISLGSMIMLALFAIMSALFGHPLENSLLAAFIALMAIWQHRTNIHRLLSNEENKFSFSKKGTYKKE
ncbi:MAG: glycerol-3-phosphate 1-O-acyltransferase PlsY [Clostridiales bacterium]|jgi:glycerol-3-phosphate acyltransferase PlsY|nr:glycerol-3-phosphate 1-O-acyltransferase PlsY [Clostridiales bacterium]